MNHPTRVAIAIVEQQGKFLIGRRPEDADLGGLWEFPGGKVKRGEAMDAAAVRECAEETGLPVRVLSEIMVRKHCYDHDEVELHFFACRSTNPAATPREPFRWVVRGLLDTYEFPSANRDVITCLIRG